MLIAGLVLVYIFVLSPTNISEQSNNDKKLAKATEFFPDHIGKYSIVKTDGRGVEVLSNCNKIEDNPILKATGKTGDACMEIFSAVYTTVTSSTTATTTNKIIKVNLSKFTKAADMLQLLLDKSTEPGLLDDKPIFHTTPFRLGWSPASGFDMILTVEGEYAVSSMATTTTYNGNADGNNEVTRYFIDKYPPKK